MATVSPAGPSAFYDKSTEIRTALSGTPAAAAICCLAAAITSPSFWTGASSTACSRKGWSSSVVGSIWSSSSDMYLIGYRHACHTFGIFIGAYSLILIIQRSGLSGDFAISLIRPIKKAVLCGSVAPPQSPLCLF